jgi:hypothetical protein
MRFYYTTDSFEEDARSSRKFNVNFVCSSKRKIFHRQSNVGSVAENHQRVKQAAVVKTVILSELPEQKLTWISTLYLQPTTLISPDENMLSCLGIDRQYLCNMVNFKI